LIASRSGLRGRAGQRRERDTLERMIRAAILICAVFGTSCWTGAAQPARPDQPSSAATTKGTVDDRFTGKITQISFGCGVDASCDLIVDGTRHVHFGHDTRGEQTPSVWGSADELWTLTHAPDNGVGRTIEVFAATTDHQFYSIQGKATYYIKLVH
jgi:hypothetical protein